MFFDVYSSFRYFLISSTHLTIVILLLFGIIDKGYEHIKNADRREREREREREKGVKTSWNKHDKSEIDR